MSVSANGARCDGITNATGRKPRGPDADDLARCDGRISVEQAPHGAVGHHVTDRQRVRYAVTTDRIGSGARVEGRGWHAR